MSVSESLSRWGALGLCVSRGSERTPICSLALRRAGLFLVVLLCTCQGGTLCFFSGCCLGEFVFAVRCAGPELTGPEGGLPQEDSRAGVWTPSLRRNRKGGERGAGGSLWDSGVWGAEWVWGEGWLGR